MLKYVNPAEIHFLYKTSESQTFCDNHLHYTTTLDSGFAYVPTTCDCLNNQKKENHDEKNNPITNASN